MSDAPGLNMARINRVNAQKRTFDVLLCLLMLPVALPLTVLVALILRICQGKGVLFTQKRLGFQNQEFNVYKFRTMLNARDADGNDLPDAERLTAVGKFLRKTSLDELPQLFNVLKGDMSFVGPRPLFVRYAPFYTPREATRHLVRPGITGLAQSDGRNYLRWDQRLEKDAQYVESVSLKLDLRIIVKTLRAVVSRKNVMIIPGLTGAPLNVYRSFPTSGEYVIRRLTVEDLPKRVEWVNQPETRAYMSFGIDEITLESTVDWFEKGALQSGRHDFGIVNSRTNELVAMTGLRDREPGIAEAYTIVAPEHRGKGIGGHAYRLTREWAFLHGGYRTIVGSVHPENTASAKMNSKLPVTVTELEGGRKELAVSRVDFVAWIEKERDHDHTN